MDTEADMTGDVGHDVTLIDWFLSLPPAQRLAELESRIAFFQQARSSDGNSELPADT
jgi:hypothetical protein